jgi:hypothetical protein
MLQQQVAAFPGPNLDESRSLQLADHLSPGHLAIVNLPLGFVKTTIALAEVLADPSMVLDARVSGTGRDGGPNCATVKPFDGWTLTGR